MRDIVDRLNVLVHLPHGSMMPQELLGDSTGIGDWDVVISGLCKEAVEEIETLREYRQRIERAIKKGG